MTWHDFLPPVPVALNPGDTLTFTYSMTMDGDPVAMNVYGSDGKQFLCEARVTRGEDHRYLSMAFDRENGLPPDIHETVYIGSSKDPFVIREIQHDMRADRFTVQAIDEASFKRMSRYIPRPPRFSSVEEADAWLERHGG